MLVARTNQLWNKCYICEWFWYINTQHCMLFLFLIFVFYFNVCLLKQLLPIIITYISVSSIVIRGTSYTKKFNKDFHQYSNKTENTFSSIESTYLYFCFLHCNLWNYSITFHPLSQLTFIFARLKRKLVLQQRFNTRTHQHSCKSLTSDLNHLCFIILHQ